MARIDFQHEVDEDEAVKLMVYHLKLAAAYYEASYADDDKIVEEALKLVPNQPACGASMVFMQALRAYYEETR